MHSIKPVTGSQITRTRRDFLKTSVGTATAISLGTPMWLKMNGFTHLRCRTSHSLGNSIIRIPELVERVRQLGMTALAVTNDGSLCAAVEFEKCAKRAGIKPIFGLEVQVRTREQCRRPLGNDGLTGIGVTLLARDQVGFGNLVQLSSLTAGSVNGSSVQLDWSKLAAHANGLFALVGGTNSQLTLWLRNDNQAGALRLSRDFHSLFRDRLFLAVDRPNSAFTLLDVERTADLGTNTGIPLVATADIRYLHRDDAQAYWVYRQLRVANSVSDNNRHPTETGWLPSPAEMDSAFSPYPDAVARAVEIASQIDPDLGPAKAACRTPIRRVDSKSGQILRNRCGLLLERKQTTPPNPELAKRLNAELEHIRSFGTAARFLLLGDLADRVRAVGEPLEVAFPPRNSLVLHLFGLVPAAALSDVIEQEPYFSTKSGWTASLHLETTETGVDLIQSFLQAKLGCDQVENFSTISQYRSRTLVSRVGSLLGISDEPVKAILQSVSTWMRPTVEHILRENPQLQALCERDDEARQLLDVVTRLDRTARTMFVREGDFVVTKLPLTGIVPSFGDRSAGASCGLQWSQPDLQSLGFQTLTVRVPFRYESLRMQNKRF